MVNKSLSSSAGCSQADHVRVSDVEALTCLHEVDDCCVRAGNDLEACLRSVLDGAIFLTAADKGTLQLLDLETGKFAIAAQRGFGKRLLGFFSHLDHHTSAACGAALRKGTRVAVADVTGSEPLVGFPDANVLLAEGVRALQATPLISRTNRVFGIISTYFRHPTRLAEREGRFLDMLARQVVDHFERSEAERLLAAKGLQLERITSQIGTFIAQFSRDLRFVFVNKPCADLLGKPAELIVGRSIRAVSGEAAFRVIRPYIERVLAGERVEFETEIPYAGSGRRHVHVIYVPDFDLDGSICGWIATINDVTQRKQLEERLRAADRHKDEFMAMLAHELRTPLAPIRYAVAAANRSGAPEYQARAREVIERQVTHMTRLLDDLLDVSRITRGKLAIYKRPTELTAVLADALEAARPFLDAKGHTVSFEEHARPVRVDGDSVRLTQVFSNLLINAAKFSEPRGKIQLRVGVESAQAIVSVRDHGMGISKELMPRLFTLFAQGGTAPGHPNGGLGVGLALVRGIVELHGGSVEASSEGPNQGSTFTVRLPIGSGGELEDIRLEPERRQTGAGLKILVADDNRDAADACAMLLELSGHHVQIAYSGRRALELAENFRPDALLLDIGMPDMDGYELAGRVRATVWGRSPLLIAVTGWGQEQDRHRAFAAGFDDHITKPVTEAALEALLESASRG